MKSSRPKPAAQSNVIPPLSNGTPRGSARCLGVLILILPWVCWPGLHVLEGYIDPKWPVALIGVALAMLFTWREGAQDEAPPAAWSWRAGAGLIVIGMLASAWASPAPGLGTWITLRQGALLTLAWLCMRCTPHERRGLTDCLIASCGLQAGLTLLQFFFPDYAGGLLPYAGTSRRAAMIGTLGNAEFAASLAGLGCALAAGSLRAGTTHEGSWLGRGWKLAIALVACASVLLSGGRGAALALLATVVIVWLMDSGRRATLPAKGTWPRKKIAAGAVLMIVLVPVITYQWREGGTTLPYRLAQIGDPHSPSMRQRIGLYAITSQMIAEHPLLGAGPGRFGAAFAETRGRLALEQPGIGYWHWGQMTADHHAESAHSEPLQWWAEYGLGPVAGLFLLLAAALVAGWSARRGGVPGAGLALFAGLLYLSFNLWVSYPLSMPERAVMFWVILGLQMPKVLRERDTLKQA